MTPSDKNRKTKRANKMLAVTKAVEIKWAAKAETLKESQETFSWIEDEGQGIEMGIAVRG